MAIQYALRLPVQGMDQLLDDTLQEVITQLDAKPCLEHRTSTNQLVAWELPLGGVIHVTMSTSRTIVVAGPDGSVNADGVLTLMIFPNGREEYLRRIRQTIENGLERYII